MLLVVQQLRFEKHCPLSYKEDQIKQSGQGSGEDIFSKLIPLFEPPHL